MLKISPGPMKIPISTFVAVSVTSLIATPLTVFKKRRQAYENKLSTINDIILLNWIKIYTINITNKFPKSFVKYSVYELLLKTLQVTHTIFISALVSSFVSSLVASMLFEPLEYKQTLHSLGINESSKNMYNGLIFGIISSILGNVIGHTLLELIAPRN